MSNKKEKIKRFFWELIAVAVGVLLAFGIDRAYDYYRDRKDENIYLDRIERELKEDREKLEEMIVFYKDKDKYIKNVYKFMHDNAPLYAIESLASQALFEVVLFKPNNITWESMKASGDLKLINDVHLRMQIADLNMMYYNIAKHQEFLESYYEQKILDYADKHINMDSRKFYNKKKILEPDFSNLLNTYHNIIQDLLEALKNANKMSEEVEKYFKKK